MKSPQDMRIIQIDITNACIHKCSNCTRFCGHHKKPFFMDWDTFKKAVDSFEGYKGTVGIMGGEPTLHPEFERFVCYIKDHPYFPKTENLLVRPAKDFMKMIAKMEQRDTYINKEHGIERRCVHGYGLWSALSGKYNEYYELIQDTFNFQALNDHTAVMYHSPIMVRRKDLHISDEEWIKARDNCWAQREWSATITPKGAFFCEIAGALDMLFDGPGGWPIEPGWWKRTPDQFGDQLKWCELCGITLSSFTRDANEEVDDMSRWYYDRLRELGSPKLKAGLVNVLDIDESGNISEGSKVGAQQVREHIYLDSYYSRFNNNWLTPKGFWGLYIIDGIFDEYKSIEYIGNASECLDKLIVSSSAEDIYTILAEKFEGDKNVEVVYSECSKWGAHLNKALSRIEKGCFICILDGKGDVSTELRGFLSGFVLNPGTLLYKENAFDLNNEIGDGVLAVLSPSANSIRAASWPAIRELDNISALLDLWDTKKIVPLLKESFVDFEYRIEPGLKYAIYGVAARADAMYQQFADGQIVAAADSNPNKWGKDFHGHTVIEPKELYRVRDTFDKVFIASRSFFEIKTDLINLGFAPEDIVTTLVVM